MRINFPNDLIRFHTSFRDFGERWDPAVGFAQRTGFRRWQPTLVIAPRPRGWRAVRQLEWEVRFEYLTDLENRPLNRNWDVTLLGIDFESGDDMSFRVGRYFERLERDFTIHGEGADAIVVPADDYQAWSWSGSFRTAGRRTLSGNVDIARSDFWSGKRTELELGATLRPRRGVSVSADFEHNRVRLVEGDFDTNLTRLSGSWNLNPLTSFTGNIQYDDVSRIVGLFARARWIVRPGQRGLPRVDAQLAQRARVARIVRVYDAVAGRGPQGELQLPVLRGGDLPSEHQQQSGGAVLGRGVCLT